MFVCCVVSTGDNTFCFSVVDCSYRHSRCNCTRHCCRDPRRSLLLLPWRRLPTYAPLFCCLKYISHSSIPSSSFPFLLPDLVRFYSHFLPSPIGYFRSHCQSHTVLLVVISSHQLLFFIEAWNKWWVNYTMNGIVLLFKKQPVININKRTSKPHHQNSAIISFTHLYISDIWYRPLALTTLWAIPTDVMNLSSSNKYGAIASCEIGINRGTTNSWPDGWTTCKHNASTTCW